MKFHWLNIRSRDWVFLLLIVFAAIVFRLLFMTKAYAIGFDEVNYLKLAASGNINGLNHVFHPYWPPIYPLIVALFSFIIPDYVLVGRLLAIAFATLIIVPLFLFVSVHFDKKIAYGVALLTAFYSFSARFSVKAESDLFYTFVAIIGIILGWSALKDRQVWKSLFLGLLFGFSYLARPEGIGFLMVFMSISGLIVLIQIFQKKFNLFYIKVMFLSFFGFGIVALPYVIYLHQITGEWTLSTKGASNQQGEMYVMNKEQYVENPFHVLSEDNTRLLMDDIYHLGTFLSKTDISDEKVISISLKDMIKKLSRNYYKLFSESLTKVLPVPLLIFWGLGLFVIPWKRDRAYLNLYLLSFVVFFWFIVIPFFHITLRYFIPLLPLNFIWISGGIIFFTNWLTKTFQNIVRIPRKFPVHTFCLILVVFVVVCTAVLPEFVKKMRKSKYSTDEWAPCIEQKKAGLWLKKNGINHPIIMSYNHAVSFYAGNYNIKESVEIPENRVDRLLEYAKYRDVNYLVLNDRYKHHHPLIDHLYEKKEIPAELKLIYFDEEPNGLKTLIYEIQ